MLRSFDGVLPLSAGDPARPSPGIVLILMQRYKPNAKPPCCHCSRGEDSWTFPHTHTPKKKEKKSLFTVLPFHQGVLTDCLTEGSSDGCIIVEVTEFYSCDLCSQVWLIFSAAFHVGVRTVCLDVSGFLQGKKELLNLDPNKIKYVIFAFWCEFAGHNLIFLFLFFLSKLCKAKAAED